MLPTTWQQDDTLDIAAELLEALRLYRAALAAGPDALERQHPGWRDGLPIDVSEEAARALVMALLQQPVAARQERELHTLCHRVLHRRGDRWRLCIAAERGGKLPGPLTDRAPFTDGGVVRVRFALAGGQIAVAERDGGTAWRFRGLQSRPTQLPFDEPATAALLVDGDEKHRMPLPGGEALHDLPWVFAPSAEDGVLRFVGYGTTETREARLFLAVDPGRGALELVAGQVEQVGPIENTGRMLTAIEGEARWREPDHDLAIRLRTNWEEAGTSSIAVTGEAPSWSIPGQLVFLGAPRITAPGSRGLVWRSGGGWQALRRPLPDGARSEVALVDDGVILDRCRIVVLPRHARVDPPQVRQGVLEVRLHGLAEAWAALDGFPDAVVREEGACRVLTARLSGPEPAEVILRTGHPGGLELRHALRIPMSLGGFAEASGRVLADRHLASSIDLPRLRARAGAADPQAQLKVVAYGQNGIALGRTLAFVEDLPLGRLRPELERLQTTLGDPDAEVRLNVLRNGIEGPRLRLRAFDRVLDLTYGTVTLADGAVPEDGGLYALDLTRPGAPAVGLRRVEQGQAEGWSLSGLQAGGPWLVIGGGSLVGHVRPRCWSPPSDSSAAGRLARAVAVPQFHERRAALADTLRHLGAEPGGEEAGADWEFLLATLRASVRHAPARFFDALAAAADVPAVLARLVFRARPEDLPSLAALESHLPLLWCLVPITTWQDAACEWAEVLRGYGLDEPLALVGTRVADWADLCPGARAAAWVMRDGLGIAQLPDLPWTLAQLRAALVQHAGLRAEFAKAAGPDPGEMEWWAAVRQVRNWINLPDTVRDGAPHVAAECAMGRPASPECVTALRICHDAAPDSFAQRVRFATLLRLAQGDPR